MKRLAWIGLAALLVGLSGCMLLPGGDQVLYEDTFSGTTDMSWHLGSTEVADKWIDNGKYYMLVKSNVYTFGYNQSEGPFDDVQIDLDVDHVLGASDVSGGGVLFRVTDFNNMYAFLVSPAGTFTVVKWVDGSRTTLLAWAESSAINKGVARNHLTVIAHGPSLSFLVNQTEVAMLTDTSFSSGRVGAAAVAFNADVDVLEAFDNLIVQSAGT
jgi:hypothetical protein